MAEPVEFIPISEVTRLTSLSKKVVYRLISEGQFPRQVPLSTRRVAWIRSQIEDWQKSKVQAMAA
jgi:prophage regulatory protein